VVKEGASSPHRFDREMTLLIVWVVVGELLKELLLGQEVSVGVLYHGYTKDNILLQSFVAEEIEDCWEFL
jgi:hypothetical protein